MSAQFYAWYYPSISTPTPKPRGYATTPASGLGHSRSRSAASVSLSTGPPLTTTSSLASRKSTSSESSSASSAASASSANPNAPQTPTARAQDSLRTVGNGPASVTFQQQRANPALQVQGGAAGPVGKQAQARADEAGPAQAASATPVTKKRQSLLHRANSTSEREKDKDKQKLQKKKKEKEKETKERRRSNPFRHSHGHTRSNSTDSVITPIPIPISGHGVGIGILHNGFISDYHYNINTPGASLLSRSSPVTSKTGGVAGLQLLSHDTSPRLQSLLLSHRSDPAAQSNSKQSKHNQQPVLVAPHSQSQQWYRHYNDHYNHYTHYSSQYPFFPLPHHVTPPHKCTCTSTLTPQVPSSTATISIIPTFQTSAPASANASTPSATATATATAQASSTATPTSPAKLLNINSTPIPPATASVTATATSPTAACFSLDADIPAAPYRPSGPTPPHSPATNIPTSFSNIARKSIAPFATNPQPPPSPLQLASIPAVADPLSPSLPPVLASASATSSGSGGQSVVPGPPNPDSFALNAGSRPTITVDSLRSLTAAATDLVIPGRRCAYCTYYSHLAALQPKDQQQPQQGQHQPGSLATTSLGTDLAAHPDRLPLVATSTSSPTAPTPKVVPADSNNTTNNNTTSAIAAAAVGTRLSTNTPVAPPHNNNNNNPHSSPRLRPRSKFGKLATPSDLSIGFFPPRVALTALELKHVAMHTDAETGRVTKMTSAYSRSESLSSASGTTASLSTRTMASSTDPSASGETLSTKFFITRNGRSYINDPHITYPLPIDLAELHRQSLRTLMLIQVFGGPVCSPAFATRPPTRVLEIGCGSGFWSMMCHRYFRDRGHGNISFTGLDIAPLAPSGSGDGGAGTAFEFAKPDRDMKWRFVQHDIHYAPFPFADGEFDLVMVKDMSLAVTHSSQQRMVDEYIRLLRPGGHLEIWESDHTIRMLRPHVAGTTSSTAATQTAVAMPADHDEEHEAAASLGAYVMGSNTPLSPPLNNFLVEYNTWLVRALELRDISPVPCTIIGPMLLQESETLCDVRSRRLAIPLSEVRWEKEGVGGVVTKDGKSYIDTRGKGKQKSDASGRNKTLSAGQAALRRTALQTVVQGIQALEPMLKEVSGKRQDEWDGWIGKMMNDLMKENGTSWGECLEVGAWWAQKRT